MSQRFRRGTGAFIAPVLVLAGLPMAIVVLDLPGGPEFASAHGSRRISVSSSGVQGNDKSFCPSISADGRYVVFDSEATNLVPGDTNGVRDVFVRDQASGTTERVSVSSAEEQAIAGISVLPGCQAISADGRYVAFDSDAVNLVPGDTNAAIDVFVRDRVAGTTERVSVSSFGVQGDADSDEGVEISADGRYVVFGSSANNLVVDDLPLCRIFIAVPADCADVFVHDRTTHTTERVSVSSAGIGGNNHSLDPDVSDDGRYVAFISYADNLVPGDTNFEPDAFVHDRQAGTTERVSVDSGGAEGDFGTDRVRAKISADGRYALFSSFSTNLVAGDTNGEFDVFVRDRQTSTTERVSVSSAGVQGDRGSSIPDMSSDGRYVVFDSFATNLVSGDTNNRKDVFRYDRQTDTAVRLSVSSAHVQGDNQSLDPAVSDDGRFVAYASDARNLVVGDTNGRRDVFVADAAMTHSGSAPVGVKTAQTYGTRRGARGMAKATTRLEADPVNTATGAFTTEVTDAVVASIGIPFEFTRSYTSADTTSGPLGAGWTHDYLSSLSIDAGTGDATVRTGGGAQLFFEEVSGAFVADPGIVATLESVTGGYELATEDLRTFTYDSDGFLTAIEDRNGEGLTLSYDASDRLDTVTTAHGDVTFAYNASDLLTSVTLPDARDVTFSYTSGLLSSVTDLRGNTTDYTYDANGRLTVVTDQNGNDVVTNVYNASGRVTSQTDATGNTGTFAWDAATQTSTYTDANGNDWVDVYDDNVLLSRTDPLGNTTAFVYDSDLNLTEVVDPKGNSTTMGYDSAGRLTSLVAPFPLDYEQTWTYTALDLVDLYTDGEGNVTDFDYDASGNLISVDEPEGATTTFAYTAEGLVDTITDPEGNVTDFDYEADGDLVTVTDAEGGEASFTYDSAGRMTAAVDPRGNAAGATPSNFDTLFSYDDADNLTEVEDPLGNATTSTYDLAGNLDAVTDATAKVTDYGYDAANRLTSVEAPDLSTTTYAYDDVGNLTSRTDANSHTTTWTYDAASRATGMTNPTGTWSYAYDANSNLETVTPPGGGTITHRHDVMDRLVGIDYSDGTPDVVLAYDANSNRVAMHDGAGTVTYAYDGLDRLETLTRGPHAFAYAYDAASDVTSRTYPDGTVVSATYDDAHRVASLTSGGATTAFGYDTAGNLVTTTYPVANGHVETRAYDAAGRLTEVETTKGATVTDRTELTLDAVGNPTATTDEAGVATTYLYDDLYRLTQACFAAVTCTGAADFVAYAYDDVGNRTSETRPSGTTTYAYNAADQLTSVTDPAGAVTTFGYDARGNQTSAGGATYAYDLADRLVEASVPGDPVTTTRYAYDGDGVRLSADTQAAGATVSAQRFAWDHNAALPLLAVERQELLGQEPAEVTRRSYVHGAGPLSMTTGTPAGTDTSYYHHDHLGTVTSVSDEAGDELYAYDYEPYGPERSADKLDALAPENPLRFGGEYLDPTGLYHLRARQYDPGTGRFTATDPVAGPIDAPYANAYGYVGARPTVFTDPSGLCVRCSGSGIGAHSKGGGGGTLLGRPFEDDYGMPGHWRDIKEWKPVYSNWRKVGLPLWHPAAGAHVGFMEAREAVTKKLQQLVGFHPTIGVLTTYRRWVFITKHQRRMTVCGGTVWLGDWGCSSTPEWTVDTTRELGSGGPWVYTVENVGPCGPPCIHTYR